MAAKTPGITTALGNPKHTTHGLDAEISLMNFDEDILHFRRFAKYVAALLVNSQLGADDFQDSLVIIINSHEGWGRAI